MLGDKQRLVKWRPPVKDRTPRDELAIPRNEDRICGIYMTTSEEGSNEEIKEEEECARQCKWLRGEDLNLRPSGYEPDELPSCSTPLRNYRGKGSCLSRRRRCVTEKSSWVPACLESEVLVRRGPNLLSFGNRRVILVSPGVGIRLGTGGYLLAEKSLHGQEMG